MTERRPHWDDELIEAVKDNISGYCFDHVEGPLYDEDVYPVIAAVEDWVYDNFQGGEYDNPVEYTPEELAIQRVREACEPFGPMGSIAVWRILRALDGDA